MDLSKDLYSDGITLKNKLNIHDYDKLAKVEHLHSAKTVNGILKQRYKITNISQLKDIHYTIFHDIYSWAGKIRNYDISKRGHNFLPYSAINTASVYINKLIKAINHKSAPAAKDYAKLLDSINDLHPFRDGNGRSTKCFLELIAINHHQFLQFPKDESEAIKGLNSSNINLIAKYITVQKLN